MRDMGTLVYSESLELAMQSRALHADEFRRARDIATEATDLRDQIFPFEDLTGVAQWQAHQVLPTVAIGHARHHRADIWWQHAGIHHRLRISASEDHQSLDVVTQLPDIARPVVRLEHGHGVFADTSFWQSRRLR